MYLGLFVYLKLGTNMRQVFREGKTLITNISTDKCLLHEKIINALPKKILSLENIHSFPFVFERIENGFNGIRSDCKITNDDGRL